MTLRSPRRTPSLLLALFVAAIGMVPGAASYGNDFGPKIPTEPGALLGQVSAPGMPLPLAKVYAYQLADLSLRKVVTDDAGAFLFHELPAGLYRIITFKQGFSPSVVMLTRSAAEARQYLDIELSLENQENGSSTDFWTLREQIPSDVLRDIEMAERISHEETPAGLMLQAPLGLETNMEAVAGVDNAGGADAQVSGGRVGIQGRVGATNIFVDGDFLSLDSANSAGRSFDDPIATGRAQKVAVEVQTPSAARVRVSSAQNRLVTDYGLDRSPREINFEAYEVSWSQDYGAFGTSDFRAHYTEENNFYNTALVTPVVLPDASRTLHLEGSFTTELSDRSTVQTGVRYRERETFGLLSPTESLLSDLPSERVELYGRGGTQVAPAFLVEYGLYSTLRDGEMSFTPRGGLVVHLGPKWRASTSFSHRIENDDIEDMPSDFFPVFYRESSQCEVGESYCYRASVSREWGEGESFVFGAVHREIGETQRLSFDEDFFNHEESLYLLPGDRLPELQFAWTRRLTPTILARVESTVASGGGGLLYTGEEPFENDFQYVVTSLDAQFERSDTGVFLMFHQLQQELSPMAEATADGTAVELEKLELMLTQDIGLMRNLASQLALQLNMEVSRSLGTVDLFAGEELRKRIMGGLAVKF